MSNKRKNLNQAALDTPQLKAIAISRIADIKAAAICRTLQLKGQWHAGVAFARAGATPTQLHHPQKAQHSIMKRNN